RLIPGGQRQVVTGLVVNSAKPNVPRKMTKNLRALLHNVIRHGWESQLQRASISFLPDSYPAYRERQLSLSRFRKINLDQRQRHLLISPTIQVCDASKAS
ncbi:MAG TPA: hypothetical protein PLA68_08200, partial [Panacibacter sp.]|nr:hypothetical protein [Panacibacter sp.]